METLNQGRNTPLLSESDGLLLAGNGTFEYLENERSGSSDNFDFGDEGPTQRGTLMQDSSIELNSHRSTFETQSSSQGIQNEAQDPERGLLAQAEPPQMP